MEIIKRKCMGNCARKKPCPMNKYSIGALWGKVVFRRGSVSGTIFSGFAQNSGSLTKSCSVG
jgi:hypothetical protein